MLKYCPHCGKELVFDENGCCLHCKQKISNPNQKTVMQNSHTSIKRHIQSADNSTSCKNVGEKIKTFAAIIVWLDVLGIIVILINSLVNVKKIPVDFLFYLIFGCAVFFAFFYGLGEIIDRLISIDEKLSNK